MDRRGFLGAILAAGIAPAVVKAANIMPVFARRASGLLAPEPDGLYVVTATADDGLLALAAVSEFGVWQMASLIAPAAFGMLRVGEVGRLDDSPFRKGDVVTIGRSKP